MTSFRSPLRLRRRRRSDCVVPSPPATDTPGWGCILCGRREPAADAAAAFAALEVHQREECPNRKVQVFGLGGYWGWTHRGCSSHMHESWDWADALRAAWWHVASHDPSLPDEQAAEAACRARRAGGELW